MGRKGIDIQNESFYLIKSNILPESIQKTIEAKRLLETGAVETIQDAVDRVDISRSAFYKYKDSVFPFSSFMGQKIVTISMNLEHRAGVLSNILSYIASEKGNVLTINQTIPLQGQANVVLTVETAQMEMSNSLLSEQLLQLKGVQKAVIVGQGIL